MKAGHRNIPNGICKSWIYYVYVLYDTRSGVDIPFYVGKGKKDRVKRHFYETQKTTPNPAKFNTIQAIMRAGYEVKVSIVAAGLSEDAAYQVESWLIEEYGERRSGGVLTNCSNFTKNRMYSSAHNDTINKKIGEGVRKAWQRPNSGYHTHKFRHDKNKGTKNPRYGDHRTWEEIHGKDKADEIKNRIKQQRKGSGNARAKQWKLVSPSGVVYELNGNLRHFCKEHNLAVNRLRKYTGYAVPYPSIIREHTKEIQLSTVGWILYECNDHVC